VVRHSPGADLAGLSFVRAGGATMGKQENRVHMISITSLMEEAALFEQGMRRDRGNVASLDQLLNPETIAKFEANYSAFAFLAFDPGADVGVVEYLNSQTVANDGGPKILTLTVGPSVIQVPRHFDVQILSGVSIEKANLPAAEFIASLFPNKPAPPLPGLAVFERFGDNVETVYFHLGGLTSDSVRSRLRAIFSVTNDAVRQPDANGRTLSERLAVFAENQRVSASAAGAESIRFEFARSGSTSTRQWLIKGLDLLRKHGADLIALVGLFKGG